jgi:hypothetical protein
MRKRQFQSFNQVTMAWMACAATTIASLVATPTNAGSLLLAPTRLLFEGGARAQELTIMNQSDDVQTYRMRLEDRLVKADGEFDVITDPTGTIAASQMLRLSSRQVTVGPRESATVRVLLRKPPALSNGEYRSHLIVTELPSVSSPETITNAGDGITVGITTIFGISIPVMVRSGETSARLSVPTIKRVGVPDQPNLDNLQISLQSTGNRSMFVNVKVLPARQRRGTPIVEARGVAVYNPTNARNLTLSLNQEQTARARAGALVMIYQEVDKDGVLIGPASELAF